MLATIAEFLNGSSSDCLKAKLQWKMNAILVFFVLMHVKASSLCKAQTSNERGVGFLMIAKSVSCECKPFKIYNYI